MKLPIELARVEGDSILRAMGYDAANKHLYAQFSAGGPVYRYLDVEEGAWRILNASESKGRFIAKCIRPNHWFETIAGEAVGRQA